MRGCLDHFFSIVVLIHLIDQIHSDDKADTIKWINQTVQVNLYNSSMTSVTNITVPDIIVYPALYFIHEKSSTSNLGSDLTTLKEHLLYVNKGLGKAKILSFIRGFAYVPEFPSTLANVDNNRFIQWIDFKLRDIWKSQIDSMTIMVVVLLNGPKGVSALRIRPCEKDVMPTMVWNYNLTNEAHTVGDDLMYLLIRMIGCFRGCKFAGKKVNCEELESKTFSEHDPDIFKCIGSEIETKNYTCGRTRPEDVALPVCGNGLLEGKEYCDCLEVASCSRDCNSHTCLKQFVEDDIFHRYLVLMISGIIVIGFVLCSSLFIFCYLNRSLGKKSTLSIALSSSHTEADIIRPPSQSESTVNPSKSKKSKSPSKIRILIDPKVKKSKSKILLDLLPKIDLSIQEIKPEPGKGAIQSTTASYKFNLDSKSSTLVKVGLPSEKTLPMLDSQTKSFKSSRKRSSTELLSMCKGDLKISSKLLGIKSKMDQRNLITKSKNQSTKK